MKSLMKIIVFIYLWDYRSTLPAQMPSSPPSSPPQMSWQTICKTMAESMICNTEYRPTQCQLGKHKEHGTNPCNATHRLIKTICTQNKSEYPKETLESIQCTPDKEKTK
ncbi:MAG: hypothetical protein OXT67_12030 [Zetaproteobacteria bacterium]|nr:hypothetical protein [Zetaproteobacteria bacterium]